MGSHNQAKGDRKVGKMIRDTLDFITANPDKQAKINLNLKGEMFEIGIRKVEVKKDENIEKAN